MHNYPSGEEEGGVNPFVFSPVLKYSQPVETQHSMLADVASAEGTTKDPDRTGVCPG